ncbi:MAG TPA: bi-domain-containing oxidoreductase [Anaerolineales bacterium]|nr:bi-domain-containing oxidoreductase [Anaerolineales bacterium]
MNQVFVDGKGALLVKEVPAPHCDHGEVLVQVAYSAISSGTESAALAGGGSLLRRAIKEPHLVVNTLKFAAKQGFKATFGAVKDVSETWYTSGYSAAGRVVAVGAGVSEFAIGDRVACAGFGLANHAEYIAVPTNLTAKLPENVPFNAACFTTIGAIALQGVRRTEPTIGETIVVVGTGLIGLLTAQILRANGCRVICTDLSQSRLQLAQKLGVEHTLQVGVSDPVQGVLALTAGIGADAVILTAGTKSSAPLNQAFKLCRERGRVVIVGAVGMELERPDFYSKEIDLRMSRSYGPGRQNPLYEEKNFDFPIGYVRWSENRNMQAFLQLVASGQVQITPLITAEYPIEEATTAFELVKAGGDSAIGVVLSYPQEQKPIRYDWQLPQAVAMSEGKVGLAMVGAGNFAKLMHIPNLLAMKEQVQVRSVVTANGGTARQAAERLSAPLATTDLSQALSDPHTQAVLITTRHHQHANECIQAAQAGKHIFVEKPLGLTVAECQDVMNAVQKSGVLCVVGFNRRFSPLAQALYSALAGVSGAKQVLYRVNAGFLPKTHWLCDPAIGGGRIIGEACHFFDFVTWLVGASPTKLSAHSLGDNPDELSAVLSFDDGSIATVIYSGLGHASAPKEHIEVLAGGKMAILDDFKQLALFGFKQKSLKLATQDKGHRALLAHFLSAVQGKHSLSLTAYDGYLATACAQTALLAMQTGKQEPIA